MVTDVAVPAVSRRPSLPDPRKTAELKRLAHRYPWLASVANHVVLYGTMKVEPFKLGPLDCTGQLTYCGILTLPEQLDGLDGEIEERFELIARENKIAAFSRRTSA